MDLPSHFSGTLLATPCLAASSAPGLSEHWYGLTGGLLSPQIYIDHRYLQANSLTHCRLPGARQRHRFPEVECSTFPNRYDDWSPPLPHKECVSDRDASSPTTHNSSNAVRPLIYAPSRR